MQAAADGDGDGKAQNIGGSVRREGEQRPAERQIRCRLQTTATADGNPATAKRRTQRPGGQVLTTSTAAWIEQSNCISF
jgi:hypothetical protein